MLFFCFSCHIVYGVFFLLFMGKLRKSVNEKRLKNKKVKAKFFLFLFQHLQQKDVIDFSIPLLWYTFAMRRSANFTLFSNEMFFWFFFPTQFSTMTMWKCIDKIIFSYLLFFGIIIFSQFITIRVIFWLFTTTWKNMKNIQNDFFFFFFQFVDAVWNMKAWKIYMSVQRKVIQRVKVMIVERVNIFLKVNYGKTWRKRSYGFKCVNLIKKNLKIEKRRRKNVKSLNAIEIRFQLQLTRVKVLFSVHKS